MRIALIGSSIGAAAAIGGVAYMMMPVPPQEEDIVLPQAPAPVVAPLEVVEEEESIPAPLISLVRVDQLGSAVIGGTAEPGIALRAVFGDEDILATRAENSGDFVMLADLPVNSDAQELRVVSYNDDGSVRAESEPVLILGREPEEAPVLVVNTDTGASVIEATPEVGEAPDLPVQLSLDTITYDEEGIVALGGKGNLSRAVRIYLDNAPVVTQSIDEGGTWNVSLPNVDAGLYTLRVDELNAEGEVTSRVESPFQKQVPDIEPGQVVVQPGNTLWALAADTLGQGDRYVLIFDANQDLIRDPNLIYPGQVFRLPEE